MNTAAARDSEASRDTSPGQLISAGTEHAGQAGQATEEIAMHEYLTKAIQGDAQRAGERDRLALKAQRARVVRRPRASPAAPVRRLARLLFRWASA